MLSQPTALLQAILTAPDDDAVRRVFADWCEEVGQADRAEFIRLQIERDPGSAVQYSRTAKGSAREKALLDRYAGEWFGPPAGWTPGQHYEVRRGFPAAVQCGPQELHDQQEWLSHWPITRLRPYQYRPEAETAHLFTEAPLPAHFRELDLYYTFIGPAVLRALAEAPALGGLLWLNVGSCHLGDAGATFLARQPHLPRLRHLDLRNNDITSVGMQALIESEHRGAVESLVLCGNEVTVDDACAFLMSERWARLTDLSLWNTKMGDAEVARLAACPALSRLTALNLNYNGITDDGVRALAASPHVSNLRTLALASNQLTSACADVLIDSPHLRGLKHLRLTNNARIHWRKRRQPEERFGCGVTFELM
ncbi:MAG TPA: TIGR02996 domain-containing protein [Gemmataceae bacterium]|nr:TIGR02996 domain-containing protein [Gemmataceae bacterium]